MHRLAGGAAGGVRARGLRLRAAANGAAAALSEVVATAAAACVAPAARDGPPTGCALAATRAALAAARGSATVADVVARGSAVAAAERDAVVSFSYYALGSIVSIDCYASCATGLLFLFDALG